MVIRRRRDVTETETPHDHDRPRLSAVPKLATAALRHLWSSDVNVAAVEMLAPRPGDHVVDLGSGLGPATGLLAEQVRPPGTVTAIDPSRTMRSILRTRTRLAGHGNVDIRNGVAESIPLPAESIDAVLSLNTMHHMSDLAQAASDLYRILKPGGRLLLIDEDFDDPQHTLHQAGGDNHHGLEPVNANDVAAILTNAGFATATGHHKTVGNQPAHIIEANK